MTGRGVLLAREIRVPCELDFGFQHTLEYLEAEHRAGDNGRERNE